MVTACPTWNSIIRQQIWPRSGRVSSDRMSYRRSISLKMAGLLETSSNVQLRSVIRFCVRNVCTSDKSSLVGRSTRRTRSVCVWCSCLDNGNKCWQTANQTRKYVHYGRQCVWCRCTCWRRQINPSDINREQVISLGGATGLSKSSWITEISVHAGFQRTSSTITKFFL
jgi:hypothetical protein